MKLTKKYLERLIKEECDAILPNSIPNGTGEEIVVDDEVIPEPEETDIEGLAHRAIAAIYELATAAGVTLSIDGGADNGEDEEV